MSRSTVCGSQVIFTEIGATVTLPSTATKKTMDTKTFTTAYNASRNGANFFVNHPLAIGGKFIFSDGVKECADAGCHWLLDILATELPVPYGELAIVSVGVKDAKARITASLSDSAPPCLDRRIDFTDMPDGQWKFYVSNDGEARVCILPKEY